MSLRSGRTPFEIAFVLDNLGSGGAQRQAVELAVRLRSEPGVFTRIAVYRPLDARDRDLHGARLAAAGVPVDLVAKRAKLDPTLPARLGAALARCDVVHAFMPAPAFWAWLGLRARPGRPRPALVAAERSALANSPPLHRWVQGLVYRRADAVTVNARPMLEELVSRLRVPRDRLHYLPNGIDLEHWDRADDEPPPWPLEPGRFHAALIGRMSAEKNHDLLLAALGQLAPEERRRWRLWFVGASTGDPGLAAQIAGRIHREGLDDVVRIAPPTPQIAALLRHLDLLVLPSRYEGFPNVVLEAMASGLLVVAAPVGDVPSLVRDGETGLLFRSQDAADLARALKAAQALDPELRSSITGRARRSVEECYQMKHVAAAYLDLYRRIAPASPARARTR